MNFQTLTYSARHKFAKWCARWVEKKWSAHMRAVLIRTCPMPQRKRYWIQFRWQRRLERWLDILTDLFLIHILTKMASTRGLYEILMALWSAGHSLPLLKTLSSDARSPPCNFSAQLPSSLNRMLKSTRMAIEPGTQPIGSSFSFSNSLSMRKTTIASITDDSRHRAKLFLVLRYDSQWTTWKQ